MKDKKKIYIGIGFVVVVLTSILIGVHIRYSNRWYPGTKIEKVDVSGMTYEAAVKKIESSMDSYQLKVKAREKGTLKIKGNAIDLKLENQNAVKNMYENQHKTSIVFSFFTKDNRIIKHVVSYSKKKLKKIVNHSELIKGSDTYKLIKPEDATIKYSSKKKYGVIKKEVLGNILDQNKFIEVLEDKIEKLSSNVDITDTKEYPKVYMTPSLYHDDEDMKTMEDTYNKYVLHWLYWELGDNRTDTIGPDIIKKYIKINTKKRTVKLKQIYIEKMIEDFCLKYKTVGMKRKFKTHSGKVIKVSGGDYGWQINYDDTLKKTIDEFSKDADTSAIDAYKKKQSKKNEEALTVHLNVKYSNKGYQYNEENKQNDWNTKNYSEVDLSNQEVYVYRNGKLKFSCICITGKPTSDRITRTGVWYVKEKRLSKTLVGADYSVDTKYWVRIMWTGTGYHYSSRGDWGSWSPYYYKSAGSHGCVNLTYSNAQMIYSLVNSGNPVFIHY
ncbi:MAG: L,D-transpeptidase family protein [Anaerostipes sp.]|nr:L,D-transpeptidase family protein [Anaerostipes sp.]